MLFESGSHVFKFEAKQVSEMVAAFGFRCGVTQYSMNFALRKSRANVQVFYNKILANRSDIGGLFGIADRYLPLARAMLSEMSGQCSSIDFRLAN